MVRALIFPVVALLSLSACTVTSHVPLIAHPTQVPGLADGSYQVYRWIDADKLRKIPRRIRALCLSPGYHFRERADNGQLTGPLRTPLFCPYDEDKKSTLAPVRLVRAGASYHFDDKERIEFQRLREGVFLWQAPRTDEEKPNFDFGLARPVIGGLDVSVLACTDFPSLHPYKPGMASAVADAEAVAKRAEKSKNTRKTVAEPARPTSEIEAPTEPVEAVSAEAEDSRCVVTSLAAIGPELDLVAARMEAGDEPVFLLLRRVAAAGSISGSPPR